MSRVGGFSQEDCLKFYRKGDTALSWVGAADTLYASSQIERVGYLCEIPIVIDVHRENGKIKFVIVAQGLEETIEGLIFLFLRGEDGVEKTLQIEPFMMVID